MKKEKISEIEAYTTLLMKCVSDIDCFDEGLVNYLLNYKKEVIENENFKKRESGIVICSDLWGYIKTSTSDEYKKRWANILNKELEQDGKFLYVKFNYNDAEKRNKQTKYNPLFEYSKEMYYRVSENFIKLITNSIRIKKEEINAENFTEIELRFIINDLLNDNNLRYVEFKEQKSLIRVLQKYILDNFKEIDELCQETKKKSFLRLLSLGDDKINYIFQSIDSKERNDLIKKYNLEEKILSYMRYKVISKYYFIDLLKTYKDKDFWIKELNCYDKDKNEFFIQNAIKDIVEINKTLDILYNDSTKFNEYTTKIGYEYTEGVYGSKNKKIMEVIKFFNTELKGAKNYKEEIEKILILAIWNEDKELYKLTNEIRKDENGNIDNLNFNHPLLKQMYKVKEDFILKIKKEEAKELKEKIENKLTTKDEDKIRRLKI